MGYAIAVSLVSMLLGTVPIGFDAWPNIIGILIGAGVIVGFVFVLCAPVLSATGRFDPLTEAWMMFKGMSGGDDTISELVKLKEDTIKAYNGEHVESSPKDEVDDKILKDSEEGSNPYFDAADKADVALDEEVEETEDAEA